MAGRIILLSAAGAFALGVLGVGALFEEPGGDEPHRRPAPAADSAVDWAPWEPLPPDVGPAAPQSVTTEAVEPVEEEVAAPDDAPLPHVWATPAEWSEVE